MACTGPMHVVMSTQLPWYCNIMYHTCVDTSFMRLPQAACVCVNNRV